MGVPQFFHAQSEGLQARPSPLTEDLTSVQGIDAAGTVADPSAGSAVSEECT